MRNLQTLDEHLNEASVNESTHADAARELILLLSKEKPLLAFMKWEQVLINSYGVSISKAKEISKKLYNKKGQVNQNHLKQLATKELKGLTESVNENKSIPNSIGIISNKTKRALEILSDKNIKPNPLNKNIKGFDVYDLGTPNNVILALTLLQKNKIKVLDTERLKESVNEGKDEEYLDRILGYLDSALKASQSTKQNADDWYGTALWSSIGPAHYEKIAKDLGVLKDIQSAARKKKDSKKIEAIINTIKKHMNESVNEATKYSLDRYKKEVAKLFNNKKTIDDQQVYDDMITAFSDGVSPAEFVSTIKEGKLIRKYYIKDSFNEFGFNMKNIQSLNEFGLMAGSVSEAVPSVEDYHTKDKRDILFTIEGPHKKALATSKAIWKDAQKKGMDFDEFFDNDKGNESGKFLISFPASVNNVQSAGKKEIIKLVGNRGTLVERPEWVNESVNEGAIRGDYLMKQLQDMAADIKRDEPKTAAALMYIYDRIYQSSRDEDLSVEDVNDFLNEPRGRKHSLNLPEWMITDLFVESFIMKEDLFEKAFWRVPKDKRDALYVAKIALASLSDKVQNGDDYDEDLMKAVEDKLKEVRKSLKKFKNKEEVTDTVYEGEILVWDEMEKPFDDIKNKLDKITKENTDPKWSKALLSVWKQIEKAEETLNNYDRKLGVITTESVNERKVPPNDETIKFHIDSYRVDDDPYDVAKEIGSQYNWTEKEIEKAEKILRKKYLK